jgi:hypothetical protein
MSQLNDDKPIIPLVMVSDCVYDHIMICLRRGDEYVYTGRADGTDRRVFLQDDLIVDGHGSLIISRTMKKNVFSTPVRTTNRADEKEREGLDGGFGEDWIFLHWNYDADGRPNRKIFKHKTTGEVRKIKYNQKDLNRAPRNQLCGADECSNHTTKQCIRCKTIHYCSVKCQKSHWHLHKPMCDYKQSH